MSSAYPSFGGMPSRPCQRCGAPLSSHETHCSRCGYSHILTQGNAPINPQSSFSAPIASSATPHPTWNNALSTTPAPSGPSNTAMPLPPPSSAPVQRQGPNSYAGIPAQPMANSSYYNPPSLNPGNYNAMPAQPSPSAFQQSAFFAPSTPNSMPSGFNTGSSGVPSEMAGSPLSSGDNLPLPPRRSRKKLSIGLLALLIVLIVGGIVGSIFLLGGPSVVGIATARQSIFPAYGAPTFTDTFQNNKQGWNLQSLNGAYAISIARGALVLEDDHNKLLPTPVPGTTAQPLRNFKLMVDALLSKGDPTNGYGIDIRGTTNVDGYFTSGYRIEFYGDGTYAVFKIATTANGDVTTSVLVDYATSSAIEKEGTLNHITIIAQGSSISVLVNGQSLKTFTDSSYASGAIELFVSNLVGAQPGAQAKFSNLAIYTS